MRIVDANFNHLEEMIGKNFVMWWYGKVLRRRLDRHQPTVEVELRAYDLNTEELGEFIRLKVNFISLATFPIGEVCTLTTKDSLSPIKMRYPMDLESFNFDFSNENYEIVSLSEMSEQGKPLVPSSSYKIMPYIPNNKSRSRLLKAIDSNSGKTVLIHCIDLFNKLYGRNSTLRRAILTSTWSELEKAAFWKSKNSYDINPDDWYVPIGRSIKKEDRNFVAAMWNHDFTRKKVKEIFSQIIKSSVDSQTKRSESIEQEEVFLDIEPWWDGPTKLKGYGINIKETNTFLLLALTQCNLSDLPNIAAELEVGKGIEPDKEKELKPGGYQHRHNDFEKETGKDFELNQDLPPGHNRRKVYYSESRFDMVYDNDEIELQKQQEKESESQKLDTTPVNSAGIGSREAAGEELAEGISEKPDSKPDVNNDETSSIVSEGKIYDLWNAFKCMKDSKGYDVSDIRFLNTECNSLKTGNKLELIKLPTDEDILEDLYEIPTSGKKIVDPPISVKAATSWLNKTPTPRGVVVFRVEIKNTFLFLIEIERAYDSDGKEEGFRGLGLVFDNPKMLKEILPELLVAIVSAKGRIANVLVWLQNESSKIETKERYEIKQIFHYTHKTAAIKEPNDDEKSITNKPNFNVALNILKKLYTS